MTLACSALLLDLMLFLPGCSQRAGRSEPAAPPTPSPVPTSQAATSAPTPPTPVGISATEDALIPPGPPGTVRVTQQDQKQLVEWQGTGDDTIKGYQVYSKSMNQEGWRTIGFVKLREDDARNRGTYRFENDVEPGCDYAVAAVGLAGKPGPKNVEIK